MTPEPSRTRIHRAFPAQSGLNPRCTPPLQPVSSCDQPRKQRTSKEPALLDDVATPPPPPSPSVAEICPRHLPVGSQVRSVPISRPMRAALKKKTFQNTRQHTPRPWHEGRTYGGSGFLLRFGTRYPFWGLILRKTKRVWRFSLV